MDGSAVGLDRSEDPVLEKSETLAEKELQRVSVHAVGKVFSQDMRSRVFHDQHVVLFIGLPASKSYMKAEGVEITHVCECVGAAAADCPVCALRVHL